MRNERNNERKDNTMTNLHDDQWKVDARKAYTYKQNTITNANPVFKTAYTAFMNSAANGGNLFMQGDKSWNVTTLKDILGKFQKYGKVSEKQIKFAESLWSKAVAACEGALEQDANREPAPSGNATVKGTIASVKYKTTYYGQTLKMLVSIDNGSKAWATVPRDLERKHGNGDPVQNLRGLRINLTATFRVSDDDKFFAFASYPKATTLNALTHAERVSQSNDELSALESEAHSQTRTPRGITEDEAIDMEIDASRDREDMDRYGYTHTC